MKNIKLKKRTFFYISVYAKRCDEIKIGLCYSNVNQNARFVSRIVHRQRSSLQPSMLKGKKRLNKSQPLAVLRSSPHRLSFNSTTRRILINDHCFLRSPRHDVFYFYFIYASTTYSCVTLCSRAVFGSTSFALFAYYAFFLWTSFVERKSSVEMDLTCERTTGVRRFLCDHHSGCCSLHSHTKPRQHTDCMRADITSKGK